MTDIAELATSVTAAVVPLLPYLTKLGDSAIEGLGESAKSSVIVGGSNNTVGDVKQ